MYGADPAPWSRGVRLKNKSALVLGASGRNNMGQAIARRYSAEGARVVVSGRSMDELESLARQIGGAAMGCDITKLADIERLVKRVASDLGGIDIAVNCVGLNLGKPFLETTESDLQRLYEVQFKGPFQFMQVVLPAMRDGGSIIQISSAASSILLDDYAAYRGTKAAIDQVVRSVADEFGQRGIRVNSILPGAVNTPMTEQICTNPEAAQLFARTSPLGRIATVEEIAAAAAWLASDECFMTGESLHVSGGLPLRRNPTKLELAAAMARAWPTPGE
jgi:NAD(P)-dependent dehydrogenase (short-subunit alcohol dehydrogenase family)